MDDEWRRTKLFAKAAEQLGADQAPVRMAGVYALARLGQLDAEQRQVVVNLLCAYLRMPAPPGADREVRATVMTVLAGKLRDWPGMDLDLSGAVLAECDLRGVKVRHARFAGTHVTGAAAFDDATIRKTADFTGARFDGETWFQQTRFRRGADFTGAALTGGYTGFNLARFDGKAVFFRTRFGPVEFRMTRFGDLDCTEGEFEGPVQVIAQVSGSAFFSGAVFRDAVAFCRPAALCRQADFPTTFKGCVDFTGTRFDGHADFSKVEFLGADQWLVRQWVGRDGRVRGAVSAGAQFKNAEFAGYADFTRTRFAGKVEADGAVFAGGGGLP